jgi:peptidoglycan/LPS O-acetylase OafA/YrhL
MNRIDRYEALDGLRGVAAIAVLMLHLVWRLGRGEAYFSHAYMAVDFFFMLSGFVIAHAYEQKLRRGMTLRKFAWLRLVRLYPLIVVGQLLGIAVALHDGAFVHLKAAVVASLAGLAVLPMPKWSPLEFPLAFPFNPPIWSLFFELAINAIYAVWIFRATTRHLAIGVAVMAGLLVAGSAWLKFSTDSLPAIFLMGSLRVGFAFPAGVLLYRVRDRFKLSVPLWALAAVLGGILVFPFASRSSLLDLSIDLIVSPLIILLGAKLQVTEREGRICGTLGNLSYPLSGVSTNETDLGFQLTEGFGLIAVT